ncbi:MAG: CBS domain-containing protein [Bacteroidetes bacterium]|nr:CBS domain-containing protein [Bacteroidota bacterium]
MKKREPVSKIMISDVSSVNELASLKDVMATFRDKRIRHMPVTKGETVIGIISATDLNRLTFGALFDNQAHSDEAVLDMLTVPQVMTPNPRTVHPEDAIREIAEIFATEQFHALPVVEGNTLRGIVTTTDVIKYMLEQY